MAAPPATGVVVLTCMDARIDPVALLGLALGDAHVLRNAGGQATDDALRSVLVSQQMLGTRAVMVVGHTRCGLSGLAEDSFAADVARDIGAAPPWPVGTFDDVGADVRRSVERLRSSPMLRTGSVVRGFVYDVDSGGLEEIAGH